MAIKIFITGTDTDIGKTMVSGLLADFFHGQGVDCGYLKLVSCGGTTCDDCTFVHTKAKVPVENVYHFAMPASPHLSAEQDGYEIDVKKLDQAMATMDDQHDVLIIEGAGGLLVPLTRFLLLGDYIAAHDVKALVVARSGLGTINHTLLTMDGLTQRAIATLGIIFNDEQVYTETDLLVTDNQKIIHDLTRASVLGRLARFDSWADGRASFQSIGHRLMAQLGL